MGDRVKVEVSVNKLRNDLYRINVKYPQESNKVVSSDWKKSDILRNKPALLSEMAELNEAIPRLEEEVKDLDVKMTPELEKFLELLKKANRLKAVAQTKVLLTQSRNTLDMNKGKLKAFQESVEGY